MKQLLLLVLLASSFASCTKFYYQVYQTTHPNLEKKDNTLVYENNDCKIMYNLWCEQGNPAFVVYNKTDQNLFVILPQSFYIRNGIAYDYFIGREYTSSVATQTSIFSSALSYNLTEFGKNGFLLGSASNTKLLDSNNSIKSGNSETIKQKPIICIPPKASKVITEYSILDTPIRICGNDQEFPKLKSETQVYDKTNTPVHFKNRIAYAFSENSSQITFIENEFWISELTNYRDRSIIKKELNAECQQDQRKVIYVNKESGPDRFYNVYKYVEKM